MELYTLISLMLGVSGGTYAALNALRTNFEGTLTDGNSTCEEHLKKVGEKHSESGVVFCESRKKKVRIKRAYLAWRICQVIPAAVFAISIFFIWGCALKDWDVLCIVNPSATTFPITVFSNNVPGQVTASGTSTNGVNQRPDPNVSQPDWHLLCPWKYSFWFLLFLGLTGIGCMVGAITSWRVCFNAKKALKIHYDGVVELLSDEQKKAEASKIAPVGAPPNAG